MASKDMKVLPLHSGVIIGFVCGRTPVFHRIHVVRGKVTANSIAIGLVLRDWEIQALCCFNQVLCSPSASLFSERSGKFILHLLVVGQKYVE